MASYIPLCFVFEPKTDVLIDLIYAFLLRSARIRRCALHLNSEVVNVPNEMKKRKRGRDIERVRPREREMVN